MKILPLFLTIALLAISCQKEKSPAEIAAEISVMEQEIGADPGSSLSKVGPLLAKYEEFIALNAANDTSKVDYLLRAGEMAALISEHGKSLAYYDQILSNFSDSPKASTALFMKGYTLDDKMDKLEEAKAIYETFLQQYPEDDFADDTDFLLKNLGKSEEEIIKQFEQQ